MPDRRRAGATLGALLAFTVLQVAADDSLIGLYEDLETPPLFAPGGTTLTIEGIRSTTGNVVVVVFDDARAFATFDTLRAAGSAVVAASTEPVQHYFPDLTAGPYAVFLFHDENDDLTLNALRGFPTEGIGYSYVDAQPASEATPEISVAETIKPAAADNDTQVRADAYAPFARDTANDAQIAGDGRLPGTVPDFTQAAVDGRSITVRLDYLE